MNFADVLESRPSEANLRFEDDPSSGANATVLLKEDIEVPEPGFS